MAISVRSYLAAGVATAAVSAIAIAPLEQSAAQTIGARLYQLSAAVQPLVQPANAAAVALGTANAGAAVLGAVTPNAAAAVNAVPNAAAAGAIPTMPDITWPAPELAASIGDFIINVYNAVEPWFQWGWSVVAWGAGWVPIVGFFAQQINIAYNTIEPLVQAVVYSFAYLIDGMADLIGPTLVNGVASAWNNFVQGEIAWFESFLPPFPPFGQVLSAPAAVAPAAATAETVAAETEAASAETTSAETASAETTPAEEGSASGTAGFKPAREAAGPAISEAPAEADADLAATEVTIDAPEVPAAIAEAAEEQASASATPASATPASATPGSTATPEKQAPRASKGGASKATGHSARPAAAKSSAQD